MFRRTFLQTVAALAAAWFFPRRLFAMTDDSRFHFLDTDRLKTWPVADPVAWCLEHRHEPILERAAQGLAKLSPQDGQRIIRLVVRRCPLNLIELAPDRVVVHHWGQAGPADLRPFFKQQGLARAEIAVDVQDRKRESVATFTGDHFLYGSAIADDFPLDLFQRKFANRSLNEPDDWTAAPGTRSGFAWEGIEANRIPWTAMKSAWRRSAPAVCQNCDTPALLVNFGFPQVSLLNRAPRFIHMCGTCRRWFLDDTVHRSDDWLTVNLDADLLPPFTVIWDRPVPRTA